jgi:phage terminase large subunit-like protein
MVARLAITPLIEAGKVFLPSGAAWLNDYIDELI